MRMVSKMRTYLMEFYSDELCRIVILPIDIEIVPDDRDMTIRYFVPEQKRSIVQEITYDHPQWDERSAK